MQTGVNFKIENMKKNIGGLLVFLSVGLVVFSCYARVNNILTTDDICGLLRFSRLFLYLAIFWEIWMKNKNTRLIE